MIQNIFKFLNTHAQSMGKKSLNLYIDEDVVKSIKSTGVNISQFVESILRDMTKLPITLCILTRGGISI